MKGRTCEAGWRNGWLDIQLNRLGQSSSVQAQDAGLVRILCVAREGAYETLHEPPTADPHGGWCGGRRLETVAYPIRRHSARPEHAALHQGPWLP